MHDDGIYSSYNSSESVFTVCCTNTRQFPGLSSGPEIGLQKTYGHGLSNIFTGQIAILRTKPYVKSKIRQQKLAHKSSGVWVGAMLQNFGWPLGWPHFSYAKIQEIMCFAFFISFCWIHIYVCLECLNLNCMQFVRILKQLLGKTFLVKWYL